MFAHSLAVFFSRCLFFGAQFSNMLGKCAATSLLHLTAKHSRDRTANEKLKIETARVSDRMRCNTGTFVFCVAIDAPSYSCSRHWTERGRMGWTGGEMRRRKIHEKQVNALQTLPSYSTTASLLVQPAQHKWPRLRCSRYILLLQCKFVITITQSALTHWHRRTVFLPIRKMPHIPFHSFAKHKLNIHRHFTMLTM